MPALADQPKPNGQPVPESALLVWACWQEVFWRRRIVARTYVRGGYVSTVFLGLDHRLLSEHPRPLVYATMTFMNDRAFGGARTDNRGEALMNHKLAVHEMGGAL